MLWSVVQSIKRLVNRPTLTSPLHVEILRNLMMYITWKITIRWDHKTPRSYFEVFIADVSKFVMLAIKPTTKSSISPGTNPFPWSQTSFKMFPRLSELRNPPAWPNGKSWGPLTLIGCIVVENDQLDVQGVISNAELYAIMTRINYNDLQCCRDVN